VPDVDAACAFYAKVLGWSFPDAGSETGGYRGAVVDGHGVAAIGPLQSADQPVAWTLYFASEDADASAAAVARAGGTVILPAGDVGNLGRLLIALDPTGAAFGVWQAGDHTGAELVNAPGGLTWEDLRSSDPEAARAFYASVFGFDYHPVEMAPTDYTTFHLAGEEAPRGGIGGFMGPAAASAWEVYFDVADTDAAVAAVRDAGGSVGMGPADTPFGRLATVVDPFGAPFLVITAANPQ
jgi:predicted enzyme related to lactoylglutathione lyase